MDKEYNFDDYQYGNTSNQAEESVTQTVEEATVQQEQSVKQVNTEQVQSVEQSETEQQQEQPTEDVNFVMHNPEPEELKQETKQEDESPIYSLKGSEVHQDSEAQTNAQTKSQADSSTQAKSESSTGTGYSYNYSYDYNNNANYTKPEKPERPRQKTGKAKKWVLCVGMAVVFGIVASVVFQVSNRVVDGIFGVEEKADKTVSTTQVTANKDSKVNSDVAAVAENVMPSVVSITNLSVQEVQNFFFGGTTTQQTESSGSGIVIGQNDSELLIVTNNHVVEGSSTLTVFFNDGADAEAQIKGTDADIDIAVIAVPLSSIESDTLDAIKVATLGDSDALSVGEPAIAIGNALGYGQSVTYGIISAVNREIEGFDSKLIQTDAAINPGNSGGALLNANGEVIGINTVKVSADAVEGMGYAIPISDVNDIINELMNRETRNKVNESQRGALGIQGVSVSEEYSQIYGIPEGVQIAEVIKGGAAEAAGLPKRGIITKFDGTSIDSMEDLQGQLEYYKAGETVEVVVEVMSEDGEYAARTYEVTLGSQSILNQ